MDQLKALKEIYSKAFISPVFRANGAFQLQNYIKLLIWQNVFFCDYYRSTMLMAKPP